MIHFPPKQANISPSRGPFSLNEFGAIDGHSNTLNSLIYSCKTSDNNQRCHFDGINPSANDEVAPILSSSLKEFLPKVYFLNVLL
jgi:hypothetical protein